MNSFCLILCIALIVSVVADDAWPTDRGNYRRTNRATATFNADGKALKKLSSINTGHWCAAPTFHEEFGEITALYIKVDTYTANFIAHNVRTNKRTCSISLPNDQPGGFKVYDGVGGITMLDNYALFGWQRNLTIVDFIDCEIRHISINASIVDQFSHQSPRDEWSCAAPIVMPDDDTVLVVGAARLHAFSLTKNDGQWLWASDVHGAAQQIGALSERNAAFCDNMVFLSHSNSFNGFYEVLAFDASNGSLLWQYKLEGNRDWTQLVVRKDCAWLYIATQNPGQSFMINTAEGKPRRGAPSVVSNPKSLALFEYEHGQLLVSWSDTEFVVSSGQDDIKLQFEASSSAAWAVSTDDNVLVFCATVDGTEAMFTWKEGDEAPTRVDGSYSCYSGVGAAIGARDMIVIQDTIYELQEAEMTTSAIESSAVNTGTVSVSVGSSSEAPHSATETGFFPSSGATDLPPRSTSATNDGDANGFDKFLDKLGIGLTAFIAIAIALFVCNCACCLLCCYCVARSSRKKKVAKYAPLLQDDENDENPQTFGA